jgi:hypothetical protein
MTLELKPLTRDEIEALAVAARPDLPVREAVMVWHRDQLAKEQIAFMNSGRRK